ncbi:MAG: hypothetical protein Tsb0020_05690 [Haliangiales bacterium]
MALLALMWLATGCPRSPSEQSGANVREPVVSFTEGAAVRALVVTPSYVFSAAGLGLERWNLETGQSLQLNAEHGLPGNQVTSMAYDVSRNWLWIATESGVTRYELQSESFSEIPPAPQVLGLMPMRSVVIEPAGDGGLWIGHPRGLYYTNSAGQWTETPIRGAVTALNRTRDGWMWIGTEEGIIALRPNGESYQYGIEQGCEITSVRFIATAPDDRPLVVGENQAGEQRVATISDSGCVSYRVGSNERWLSADPSPDGLILLTDGGLYTLLPAGDGEQGKGELRLTPSVSGDDTDGAVSAPYVINPLRSVELPAGAHIVASLPGPTSPSGVLVGTLNLGTAVLVPDKPIAWLRRSELVDDATLLTVACLDAQDCFLGTGSQGWRYRRSRFEPVDRGDSTALAFARSPSGEIYALVRTIEEHRLIVERLDGDTWAAIDGAELETPGIRAEPSFARFAPDGSLWMGVRYREELGGLEDYGVVQIDVDKGAARLHRNRRRRRQRGTLRIPPSATDATFFPDGEVWLASPVGAIQVRDGAVKVHREQEGLKTEVVRAVTASPGGLVFIASNVGVGSFGGERWSYPPALAEPCVDIDVGPDGRLWMATERGVAVYNGVDARFISTASASGDGLLEDQIDELVIDHLGRVWLRSALGVSMLAP